MQLPEAHIATMRQILGHEFDAYMAAFSTSPPVSIRINQLKWQGVLPEEKVRWSDTGYYLPERPSFTKDPLFHAGCYYVQEASSMSIEQALKEHAHLNDDLRLLDLCAAPGGKSTHLLSLISENSLLVSNEVIRSRAHVLAENCIKWGRDQVMVTNNDPQDFSRLEGYFDVILTDVPCSGEGLFRRDPEAANEWSTQNVDLCAARQKRIIHDVWPALKEGGLLLYTTCTFNRKENEFNLLELSKDLDFESLPVSFEPSLNIEHIHYNNIHGYHFYPHKIKGEGFFLAVLRKKNPGHELSIKSKSQKTSLPDQIRKQVEDYLLNANQFEFVQQKEQIIAIRKTLFHDVQYLSEKLHCIHKGIPLAETQKGMKPSHELAMSVHLNRNHFKTAEIDPEEALKYLAKQDINLPGEKGIRLITCHSMPLGWLNCLGNRANNLYPKEWRIRHL